MSRNLKKGPQGGVYYVARSGARVYVERSSLTKRELVRSPLTSASLTELHRQWALQRKARLRAEIVQKIETLQAQRQPQPLQPVAPIPHWE